MTPKTSHVFTSFLTMTHLLLAMPVAVPQIGLLPPPFGSGDIKKDLPPRHVLGLQMDVVIGKMFRTLPISDYPISSNININYWINMLLILILANMDIQYQYPISISNININCRWMLLLFKMWPSSNANSSIHQWTNLRNSIHLPSSDAMLGLHIPSGKHTKSYWTWPFIVDFPIKNCDFP